MEATDKEQFEIIFLDDEDLGIPKDREDKNARPCIILEILDDENAKVLVLTTKKGEGYIKLDTKITKHHKTSYYNSSCYDLKVVNKLTLLYSDSAEVVLLQDDVENLKHYFEKCINFD